MQFVHAVLSLHIAQNSRISQTSQTVRSGFDQFVLWYGNLPQLAQTAITVVVGAIVAYLVFKIVAHLVKRSGDGGHRRDSGIPDQYGSG